MLPPELVEFIVKDPPDEDTVIPDPETILVTGNSPLTEELKSVILDDEWECPLKDIQFETPSPILRILFVISYPGSPLANTGLAEIH